MNKNWRIETRAIHASGEIDGGVGAVSSPIFQTSTYRVKYPGDESGYVYSRTANPTREALEKTMAAMENGRAGFAFASGMAAADTVMKLLRANDHVVVGDDLYGGCFRLFDRVLSRSHLEFSYVDARDTGNIAGAIKKNTRIVWLETPTNPLMYLYDISAVAEVAHKNNCLLVVDNTFASPYIQRPLELGADIVLHSLTKYIAGHADSVGGALVTAEKQLAEKIGFYQNAVGAVLGPMDSFLTLRGLKTLALRMEKHSENARRVAEFLANHPLVKRVLYPGLDGRPLPNDMRLPGGMLSFYIEADLETVKQFAMATKIFVLAESLGGVESLINHPALMTHASIPKDIRDARGITDNMIRLSIGIENVDDLIDDLKQAFETIKSSALKPAS